MKSYFCPKCGAEVPLSDINVSADLMLCKSCGETSSFAEAVSETSDERILLNPPPKHLRIETDPMDPERRTTITYKKVSLLALFFVPFTCFWAGGSMAGIYGSQIVKGAFDPKLSLFGLPFLIGSIVLVSACLFMLFGKRVLELKGGEAKYFAGLWLMFQSAATEKKALLLKDLGEAFYRWTATLPNGPEALEAVFVPQVQAVCEQAGLQNSLELVRVGQRFDNTRHTSLSRGVEVVRVKGWVVLRSNGSVYAKALVDVR